MSIIIKKIDNENWLLHVMHQYINFTPFTNPSAIEDIPIYMKVGRMHGWSGLEIDKEYSDLDWTKDFYVVKRIPKVKHEDGLVYDDLFFKLKPSKLPQPDRLIVKSVDGLHEYDVIF
jgi:hypothetical protein